MRVDFGQESWLFPMPVLLIGTYDEDGVADVMNAAWGGIHDTNQIGICLSATHKTTKNILKKKVFTVSFATEEEVIGSDYVGLVSQNQSADKMKKTAWHLLPSDHIDAPYIRELPVCLECSLIRYDESSGYLTASIEHVLAEPEILSEKGTIDFRHFHPIGFQPSTNEYYAMGNVVGKAFSDGKKLMKNQ